MSPTFFAGMAAMAMLQLVLSNMKRLREHGLLLGPLVWQREKWGEHTVIEVYGILGIPLHVRTYHHSTWLAD